jgi:4-amino-4-deoxy-L-arabinose transferase-like glycosyltransferase
MNSCNNIENDSKIVSPRSWLAPATLMLFAAALRIFELGTKSLWIEEAKAVAESTRSLPGIFLLHGSQWYLLWQNIALHIMQWFSDSEFAVRLPSALAGVIAVGLFHRYLKKRFDSEIAFVGGFVLSILPGFVMQSQEATTYPILICLTLVLLLRLDKFLEKGGRANGSILGLAYVALIFAHPFGLYLLLPVTVYLLIRERKTIANLKRYSGWDKLFVGALVLAVAAATTPFLKLLLDRLSSGPLNQQSYYLWNNTDFFAIIYNYFSTGGWWPPASAVSEPLVWLFTIGFLAASLLYRNKPAALWREQLWFWGMLIPAYLMVTRVTTVPRYMIPLIVPATAIWSVGTVELAKRAAKTIAAFKDLDRKIGEAKIARGLIVAALTITSAFFLPHLINYYNDGHHYLNTKGDFKSAAEVISENWKPGDLFFLVGDSQAITLAQYYLPQIVDYPVDFRPSPTYSAILNEAGKNRRSYVLLSNQKSWREFIKYNQDTLASIPSWHFLDWHLVVLDVPSRKRERMTPWSTKVEANASGIRQAEQFTTIYRKYPQVEVNRGNLTLKAEIDTGLLYLFDLPQKGKYKLTVKAMAMNQDANIWLSPKINGFETLPMNFDGSSFETDSVTFEAKAGVTRVSITVGREGVYGESGVVAIDWLKIEQAD